MHGNAIARINEITNEPTTTTANTQKVLQQMQHMPRSSIHSSDDGKTLIFMKGSSYPFVETIFIRMRTRFSLEKPMVTEL